MSEIKIQSRNFEVLNTWVSTDKDLTQLVWMLQSFGIKFGIAEERFWRNVKRNMEVIEAMDLSHRVVVPVLSAVDNGAKVVTLAELDVPRLDERNIYTISTSKVTEHQPSGRYYMNCVEMTTEQNHE